MHCLKSQYQVRNFGYGIPLIINQGFHQPSYIKCYDESNYFAVLGDCAAFSEDACRSAGIDLGLKLGGEKYAFTGDYPTKGCYAYTDQSKDYAGEIYFGTGGTQEEMQSYTSKVHQFRPEGYDCKGSNQ